MGPWAVDPRLGGFNDRSDLNKGAEVSEISRGFFKVQDRAILDLACEVTMWLVPGEPWKTL